MLQQLRHCCPGVLASVIFLDAHSGIVAIRGVARYGVRVKYSTHSVASAAHLLTVLFHSLMACQRNTLKPARAVAYSLHDWLE